MAYAYKNLKTPQNVQSGIGELLYVAPFAWFAANGLKCPVAPFGVTPGDEITITDDHVFLADKGFITFQLAPRKNSLGIKTVGELGLNGQVTEVDFFIPGSYKEAHEAVKNLLNTPLVGLVKERDCSLVYQVGCDCMKAWFTGDFTSGTTQDGVKGHTSKMMYDGGALFYEGAIDLLAD